MRIGELAERAGARPKSAIRAFVEPQLAVDRAA